MYPEDYLKFMSVWVQIRNIPVNYHTPDAIFKIGGILGEVTDIAFDSNASQRKDYIRVCIIFDVSQPVRRSRVVTFPKGEEVKLLFDFERVQKRCYICQRLTHDKANCPMLLQIRRDATLGKETETSVISCDEQFITDKDQLLGVLSENQVGRDAQTERRKIAKAVLTELRQYLLASEGEDDRKTRALGVQATVAKAEAHPISQRRLLRLESMPIIHTNVDKGKGIMFVYDETENTAVTTRQEDKLLASSFRSFNKDQNDPLQDVVMQTAVISRKEQKKNKCGSTVYGTCPGARSSGAKTSSSRRRRPPRNQRRAAASGSKNAEDTKMITVTYKRKGSELSSTQP